MLAAFSFQGVFAQAQTTVFGNLGVENVNISIVNTQYGTSTDAKGYYELPLYDRSKTVNLYYSCIGYQDTLVSLTPKRLQRDSINVSFRMRKNEFLKDEATGKTYGLFVDDGMNHLGLYDPETGTVGMGQKASKKIYPRVFKVHGGYAYSVFFDSGSNRGVMSRVNLMQNTIF